MESISEKEEAEAPSEEDVEESTDSEAEEVEEEVVKKNFRNRASLMKLKKDELVEKARLRELQLRNQG